MLRRSALLADTLSRSLPARILAASHRSSCPSSLASVSTYRKFHASPSNQLQNIFDTAEQPPLSIEKLTNRGFHLSDGLVVPGGLIFIDGRVLMWNVDPPGEVGPGGLEEAWKGWSKYSFAVFETIVPRPGSSVLPPPKAIREYVSSLGIQLDVMNSRNAASTYNLLFEEGRTVAAALCPLKPVDPRTGGPR